MTVVPLDVSEGAFQHSQVFRHGANCSRSGCLRPRLRGLGESAKAGCVELAWDHPWQAAVVAFVDGSCYAQLQEIQQTNSKGSRERRVRRRGQAGLVHTG